MADVFISYKSERRPAVEHLKRVLENYGYSAWFDYGLLSGQPFGRLIEREIRSARAVVVLWCSFSVTSRWVLEEASLAEELSTLVPSRIEQISLPFGYRSLDTIDLAFWDGNPRSGATLDRLLRQIAIKVGRNPKPNFDALAEQEAQWQIHRKSLAEFPLDLSAERLDEERDRQKAQASREAEEALKREAERQQEIARQAEQDRIADEVRRFDQLRQHQGAERAKQAAPESEAARVAEAARQRENARLEQERRSKEELDRDAETKRLADERRNQKRAARQAFLARMGSGVDQVRDAIVARKNWILGTTGIVGATALLAVAIGYNAKPDQPAEAAASRTSVEAKAAAPPVPTLSRTLTGHNGWVNSAVFSPDGRRIVTASEDETARVWDAETGGVLATITGHRSAGFGGIESAAFSPDGRRIVTASKDNTARVWDADSGRVLVTFTGHSFWIRSAAFSPDGRRIVTASWDKTARVWTAKTGLELATLTGHSDWVNSATFSPDGRRIVTASLDKTARVWGSASGRVLTDAAMLSRVSLNSMLLRATLSGHTAGLHSATFSPDGRRIVTASKDKTARVWDADSGRLLATLTGHNDEVNSATFSPDGRRIVTASKDNTARVWDADSGRLLATLTGHIGWVNSGVFSPDGRRIVTASRDETARMWTLE